MCDVRRGLRGVYVEMTSVSQPTLERLSYRGKDIHLLAAQHTFDEVAYLLLHERMPSQQQLEGFRGRVQKAMLLPDEIVDAIRSVEIQSKGHVLQAVVALLGQRNPDREDNSRDANIRKGERLLGELAAVVGLLARGRDFSAPEPDGITPHSASLLRMIRGERGTPVEEEVLDKALILYAEHGLAASTFTARTIASTHADLHRAIAGAIGSLDGCLHGGAIARVREVFEEIKEPDGVQQWFAQHRHDILMGFGHRVYSKGDCRAGILRAYSEKLADESGDKNLLDIADTLQALVLKEKELRCNLDFPAAIVFEQLRIPKELSSAVFACARVAGWCAHLTEQFEINILIRPMDKYVADREERLRLSDARRTAQATIAGRTHKTNESSRKVFISHGGSSQDWRVLKDYLVDRLGLDFEEFDRMASAGMYVMERIQQMLDACCFAFIVMTGEDEQANAKYNARLNVVHELGMCQVYYGRTRAVVLLEEGCEEFSNIAGIVQIKYPSDKITAEFDNLRKVLEREAII